MAATPRVDTDGQRLPVQVDADDFVAPRRRASLMRQLLRNPATLLGLLIVSGMVLVAVLAPVIAPHDPSASAGLVLQGPSSEHPFGTDAVGRDVLSRIIHGARLSLGAAALIATLVTVVGVTMGVLAGYLGGLVDAVVMRVIDALLAFPNLILALVITGLFEPGIMPVLIALTSVWWASYARIVRSVVLSIRERSFVEAARGAGASRVWIMARHVLPQTLPHVVILASLEMGSIILAMSALNFLGVGVQPPTPEWGAMLNSGRHHLFTSPHLLLVPGTAISIAVLGCNLLGDGLRDVLDPRVRT